MIKANVISGYSNIDIVVAKIKIDKKFFFGFKKEKTKVEKP